MIAQSNDRYLFMDFLAVEFGIVTRPRKAARLHYIYLASGSSVIPVSLKCVIVTFFIVW